MIDFEVEAVNKEHMPQNDFFMERRFLARKKMIDNKKIAGRI